MSPFDRWLTDDEPMRAIDDELDPVCSRCGQRAFDHDRVQIATVDGDDYETVVCRQVTT